MKISTILLFGCATLACACTSKTSQSPKTASVGKEVRLGIWSNYVTPETLASFEQKTGMKVLVSNYSSNEELLAKMQAGGSGFDVVVPSDYMVSSMIKLNLLKKLDVTQVPSAAQLDARFMHQNFDPKNEYSLPFDWGTTGIAVNRKLYQGEIRGWKDLFTKPDLVGKIAMLDDAREVIGAAIKMQGHSLNTHDPKDLEEAKKLLLASRKRIKLYSSEPYMTLVNGEAPVTQSYVGDAIKAKKSGSVDYILPEEGGTFSIDNLVIPTSSTNGEGALALISFLLEPKTVALTVQSVFISPTSQAALSLLPPEILGIHVMFPTAKELSKFELLEDLGTDMPAWEKVWTELKASGD